MTQPEIIKSRMGFIVQEVRRRLFGMAFGPFYLLILGLAVLQNGVWYSPLARQYLLMSKDIFRNPFLGETAIEWVTSSFLGPALAYYTSMNRSLLSYCILQLAIFLVGFTALILVVRHRNGDFIARTVLIVFFLSPLPHVLFTWLGAPDILTTLLSMVIVVFWGNPVAAMIGGFLLGVNHPEQGATAMLLLTLFSLLTRRIRDTVAFALAGVGSLILGAWAVQWFFTRHNFDIVFTRVDYIIGMGLPAFLRSALSEPFALLFSLYNALILFVAVYLWFFWRKGRLAVAFVSCSLLAFVSILFTLDQTRVFAILTFPPLLLLVMSPSFQEMEPTQKEFFESVLAIAFIAGILIPRFVVWNGSVSSSAYAHIIAYLHAPSGPLPP